MRLLNDGWLPLPPLLLTTVWCWLVVTVLLSISIVDAVPTNVDRGDLNAFLGATTDTPIVIATAANDDGDANADTVDNAVLQPPPPPNRRHRQQQQQQRRAALMTAVDSAGVDFPAAPRIPAAASSLDRPERMREEPSANVAVVADAVDAANVADAAEPPQQQQQRKRM